jgi:hypothetical protein
MALKLPVAISFPRLTGITITIEADSHVDRTQDKIQYAFERIAAKKLLPGSNNTRQDAGQLPILYECRRQGCGGVCQSRQFSLTIRNSMNRRENDSDYR